MSAEELQAIKDSLHRIEKAISGDEALGHKGIASRLKEVENKMDATDKKLLVWGGIATGLSIAFTHLKDKLFGH